MEGKKREDEYIYAYLKNLGIKCELRQKRSQYFLISNPKNKTIPNIKVTIRKSLDFNPHRDRSSFLIEEELEHKKKSPTIAQTFN